jgi:hypothetical protein
VCLSFSVLVLPCVGRGLGAGLIPRPRSPTKCLKGSISKKKNQRSEKGIRNKEKEEDFITNLYSSKTDRRTGGRFSFNAWVPRNVHQRTEIHLNGKLNSNKQSKTVFLETAEAVVILGMCCCENSCNNYNSACRCISPSMLLAATYLKT